MSQLRHRQNRLDELNLKVAIVTFELDVVARIYVDRSGLDWPLLIDKERHLYQAYGMGSGNWWQLAGPAAIWKYLKLLFGGGRLRKPTGDVRQLGGDVMIDPEGVVRFHRISRGPADRPDIDRLLGLASPCNPPPER